MTSLLQASPYPFSDPVAQELHRVVTVLYPKPDSAMLLAQRAGVATEYIMWAQPVVLVWKDVLERAALEGKLAGLVTVVRDNIPPTSPAKPFLTNLIEGTTPALNAEPRTSAGEPTFLTADD